MKLKINISDDTIVSENDNIINNNIGTYPNIKLKFKYQLPGAIIAATGWSIFSWGFSVYVDNFSAFSIYGGLSALFFILMWMYICMYLLLIGAYINCYFYKEGRQLMTFNVLYILLSTAIAVTDLIIAWKAHKKGNLTGRYLSWITDLVIRYYIRP